MKNRILMITLVSITLFGLSLAVTAAQSQIINLAANESLEINCDGDTLNVTFESQTKAIAECSPGEITPTPTEQPSTAFDDWLDTDAHNSLAENDDLFNVVDLEGAQVLGTTSSLEDIHSHFVGAGSDTLSNYEYTGQMLTTAADGSYGVTFFSQYPQQDAYYRLSRNGGESFQLNSHGTSISGGTIDTGIVPEENMWYRFRVEVRDTGTQTEMKVKIWPTTDSEPGDWQAEAFDDNPTRLTTGTIGVWSMSSGGKYWHDMSTHSLPESTDPPQPEPTDTPTPEPTDTPTPEPTDTPAPEPTDTPTPEPDPTDVSPEISLCPDHNPDLWHPLFDAERNCHYNHEHKHDPNEVNDIFGPPGAWFGGTSISYPWETPEENILKHNAYGWIVRRDLDNVKGKARWFRNFRLQFHGMSGPPGTLTRFHSFSLEAEVCSNDGCGIVRTGGFLDYGNLEVKDFGNVGLTQQGQDDQTVIDDLGRRRIHFSYPPTPDRTDPRFKTEFFWYGRNRPEEPPYSDALLNPLQIAVATGDAFSNVDPEDPENPNYFCFNGEVFTCNKNASTISAHIVKFTVKPTLDPDGDGFGDFIGFTDRYGKVNQDCEEVGLDCVPLVIVHAPVGGEIKYQDSDFGIPSAGTQDFDTSPPGEWWIAYPN